MDLELLAIFFLSSASIFLFLKVIQGIMEDRAVRKRLQAQQEQKEIIHETGLTGIFKRLAVSIGEFVEKTEVFAFGRYFQFLESQLQMAGLYDLKPATFFGRQVLIGIGILVYPFLIGTLNPFVLSLLFAGGFVLPLLWLKEKINKRHHELFKSLPEALDILTLLVEAGLDFGGAFNKVIETTTGPLTEEFSRTQQEIKLGRNRIEAFTEMSKRVNNKYLTSVMYSIIQSMQLGAPIGQTLRALSEQYRAERVFMAEKLGAQAPVKMLFPMVLFIFPTIFIIIFGPIGLMLAGGRLF